MNNDINNIIHKNIIGYIHIFLAILKDIYGYIFPKILVVDALYLIIFACIPLLWIVKNAKIQIMN